MGHFYPSASSTSAIGSSLPRASPLIRLGRTRPPISIGPCFVPFGDRSFRSTHSRIALMVFDSVMNAIRCIRLWHCWQSKTSTAKTLSSSSAHGIHRVDGLAGAGFLVRHAVAAAAIIAPRRLGQDEAAQLRVGREDAVVYGRGASGAAALQPHPVARQRRHRPIMSQPIYTYNNT